MDVQRQGVDWWSHTKMCSISQRTRPTTHIHIYMSSIYILLAIQHIGMCQQHILKKFQIEWKKKK